jgi:hypothetical protein
MTFRESDGRIVPLKSGPQPDGTKPSNIGAGKAVRPIRDPDRAPSVLRDGITVITRLDHIHQRAITQPDAVFNNLFSLLNEELLRHAFRRLKRGKAPGVDGVTLEDYRTSFSDFIAAAIDLNPACVRTFRKGMERRDRWASPVWKISSSSELSS